jgi:hypothetical protein
MSEIVKGKDKKINYKNVTMKIYDKQSIELE